VYGGPSPRKDLKFVSTFLGKLIESKENVSFSKITGLLFLVKSRNSVKGSAMVWKKHVTVAQVAKEDEQATVGSCVAF
jgi:hypothetical protein